MQGLDFRGQIERALVEFDVLLHSNNGDYDIPNERSRPRVTFRNSMGHLLLVIGVLISFYFAFAAPSSPPGSDSVNLDLLNQSLRGDIFGGVITIFGAAFYLRSH